MACSDVGEAENGVQLPKFGGGVGGQSDDEGTKDWRAVT